MTNTSTIFRIDTIDIFRGFILEMSAAGKIISTNTNSVVLDNNLETHTKWVVSGGIVVYAYHYNGHLQTVSFKSKEGSLHFDQLTFNDFMIFWVRNSSI